MECVLIAGARRAIGRQYELLLWRDGRRFVKAHTIQQCFDLARSAAPDLIVIDSELSTTMGCHDLALSLKAQPELADKPILLVAEPPRLQDHQFLALLDVVDGVLPEQLGSTEIEQLTQQHI